MRTTLVWLRNDLRLHDHLPLQCALEKSDRLLLIYCLPDSWFQTTTYGFPKISNVRLEFLFQSLADLRKHAQERGGELIFRQGNPPKVIAELAEHYQVDGVFAHREHAPEEKREEDKLRDTLKVPLRLYDGNSLLKETELPFSLVDLPKVFSNFRKQVEKKVQISRPIAVPKILPAQPQNCLPGIIPNLEDMGFEPLIRDIRSVYRFAGGETAALSRVQHYLWKSHAIKTYKKTRNGMLKPDDSAKLSPWLALGCLSPKHVYQEVRRYENDVIANDSTYWLIFEIWWREFFRWITRLHGENLFRSGGIRNQSPKVANWDKCLDAWCQGQTGVPFVDANMRKLNATGYMSNRGRQNVASFLVRDLRQDWRLGAAYFESRLIDYDVHSNWGNWNYVAGVGNDPREDRYFNLVTQTLRYDPNGEFIIRWVPELRDVPPKEIPHIVQFTRQQREKYRLGAYPEPIVFSSAWRR